MSLQAIRDLRLKRMKPDGLVSVVIGKTPVRLKNESTVEIVPGSQPQFFDWRPLVGLWVAFYNVAGDRHAMDSAMGAAHAAGARLFGFAELGSGYPLALFESADDEDRARYLLSQELEVLCS